MFEALTTVWSVCFIKGNHDAAVNGKTYCSVIYEATMEAAFAILLPIMADCPETPKERSCRTARRYEPPRSRKPRRKKASK